MRWPAAGLSFLLVASPVRAAMQSSFTPSVSIAAGADDNVLFETGGTGDQVARADARVHARLWERRWHVAGDLGVAALGFDERQRVVPLGEARLTGVAELARAAMIEVHGRLRAADDPLALAQVGLIAGRGRTLGYRTGASWAQRLDRRWSVVGSVAFDGIRFFDGGAASDGDALGLGVVPRFLGSRALTLQAGLEGRLYLQDGVVARSAAFVPGARWRVGRRQFLEASAGPQLYDDPRGTELLGVARARWTKEWRAAGLDLRAAHDLTVPASRGGVLAGELVEAVGRYGPAEWELRARAGWYRSRTNPRAADTVNGYGLEAGAFRRLGGGVWLGLTASRFERLASDVEPGVSRTAAYLRLDWTGGRP